MNSRRRQYGTRDQSTSEFVGECVMSCALLYLDDWTVGHFTFVYFAVLFLFSSLDRVYG
ncbi:hypothetical protein K474DRAFT_1668180, partial [Panus rudis PR-1116 ss-1]